MSAYILATRRGVSRRPSRSGSSPMASRISRTARSMRGRSIGWRSALDSGRVPVPIVRPVCTWPSRESRRARRESSCFTWAWSRGGAASAGGGSLGRRLLETRLGVGGGGRLPRWRRRLSVEGVGHRRAGAAMPVARHPPDGRRRRPGRQRADDLDELGAPRGSPSRPGRRPGGRACRGGGSGCPGPGRALRRSAARTSASMLAATCSE